MTEHRYGRGTFEAHPEYVEYMRATVEHPAYEGMPNAVSEDGRVNWQVSSGKTTSFYKYYEARNQWWEAKAAELDVEDDDKFTITARLIHPTGWRPCRLCGEARNVGYYYLSYYGAKKANAILGADEFEKLRPIDEVLALLDHHQREEFADVFPERAEAIETLGVTPEAFARTSHLKTRFLSPGYMGNPPDRLDGFHDYCTFCREGNDPGRSPENLRSYTHDRRAFEWWAEGDWGLADALYNLAGSGICSRCGVEIGRISPDHVGPLACGFKQLPLFVPLCQPCNSAKNRRMSSADIARLIDYEVTTGDSAASWQVQAMWDEFKAEASTEEKAAELSAQLRALEDLYFRILHGLLEAGHARFMTTLLSPDYAFFDHEFVDLDPATLTFSDVRSTPNQSNLRFSLACRSVRVAFADLKVYVSKTPDDRRIRASLDSVRDWAVEAAVNLGREAQRNRLDDTFDGLLRPERTPSDVEKSLRDLLWIENRIRVTDYEYKDGLRQVIADAVNMAGVTLG